MAMENAPYDFPSYNLPFIEIFSCSMTGGKFKTIPKMLYQPEA
jgi:hypothetical protein